MRIDKPGWWTTTDKLDRVYHIFIDNDPWQAEKGLQLKEFFCDQEDMKFKVKIRSDFLSIYDWEECEKPKWIDEKKK